MNIADSHNGFPIHAAAREGHARMLRKLVDLGADVDVVDDEWRTALDLSKSESLRET